MVLGFYEDALLESVGIVTFCDPNMESKLVKIMGRMSAGP